MRACVADGLPRIGPRQLVADAAENGFRRNTRHANARDGLQRCDDAQCGKSRNVLRVNQFDMFNAVAGVALAVLLLCKFIGINGPPHAAIADGVGGDLQAMRVGARHNGVQFFGCVKRRTLVAGVAWIVIQHQRRQGFHHAIDEQFHPA